MYNYAVGCIITQPNYRFLYKLDLQKNGSSYEDNYFTIPEKALSQGYFRFSICIDYYLVEDGPRRCFIA